MIAKPQPNDRNNSTQHVPTLLPSVCKFWPNDCNISTEQMNIVATCCKLKIELARVPRRNIVARTWPNDYNIMQHPQMLHEKCDHFQIRANNTQNVATGWLNARNMLRYVALRMTRTIAFSRPVSYRTAGATEVVVYESLGHNGSRFFLIRIW